MQDAGFFPSLTSELCMPTMCAQALQAQMLMGAPGSMPMPMQQQGMASWFSNVFGTKTGALPGVLRLAPGALTRVYEFERLGDL